MEVVFHQAKAWLEKKTPGAAHNKGYPSTASAVLSLMEIGSTEIAAIGGAKIEGFPPVVAENIQTEPNITIFCRVQKQEPDWSDVDHVLLGIDHFAEPDFKQLAQISADYGCGISSNWIAEDCTQRYGIFELKGE